MTEPEAPSERSPRSGVEERLEGTDGLATTAPLAGPALVIAAVIALFVPVLGGAALLVVLGLLTLSPIALSLGWRPGGLPRRAQRAAVATAVLLASVAAAFGLLANPCVADPVATAALSGGLFTGTLLVATLAGRALALQGGLVLPALVAGAIGGIGFFYSLALIGQRVFVLC